jgi:hypothetical protein
MRLGIATRGTVATERTVKVGIAYAGRLATSARDHAVKANFSWRF